MDGEETTDAVPSEIPRAHQHRRLADPSCRHGRVAYGARSALVAPEKRIATVAYRRLNMAHQT
jgi:hypothetical protein